MSKNDQTPEPQTTTDATPVSNRRMLTATVAATAVGVLLNVAAGVVINRISSKVESQLTKPPTQTETNE